MPHDIQLHCAVFEWTMELTGDAKADDFRVIKLDQALRDWRNRTALASFEVTSTGVGLFEYKVVHTDAREINGTLNFTINPADPSISLNCPDEWAVTEYLRDDLRKAITNAINEIGMTGINVTFF